MEEEEEEGALVVDNYDDDDIYGDLDTDIFAASAAKRIRVDDIKHHEDYQNLMKENHVLKCKNKKLERENKAYSDNISALYLTAKSEIDKKNFIIKNLTQKLKQVTQSKSTISCKETEEILTNCQESLRESQAQVTLNEIKECLKKVPSVTAGNKKHIKFGNMSLYFFREQVPFQREESVKFPSGSGGNPQSQRESLVKESREKSLTSHLESSENMQLSEKGQSSKPIPGVTTDSDNPNADAVSCPNSVVVMIKGHDNVPVSNTNDAKSLSPPPREMNEPDHKRQRSREDAHHRTESDRDKSSRRSSGGERYSGYNKGRNREKSPPATDRYHRKPDDDRYNRRGREGREYDSRRSENHKGQHWRGEGNRTRPVKRFLNDTKFSTATNGKHSRSRSKSK